MPDTPAASRRVTKAVIPAAGLGTRFLPVTKAVPKEMLPVVDRPSIQYVVEEAVAAGLTDILVVTSRGKSPIEDHFDRAPELEAVLEQDGKLDLLADVRAPTDLAAIHYLRQGETKGLGHAVGVARHHVGDESFVVILGDDIMIDDAVLLRRMLEVHEREGGTVLALLEVPPDQISSYGSVAVEEVGDDVLRVHDLVEKPPADEAPSNLAVIGRYVFTPSIFDALDRIEPGVNGEYQLTDAMALLLESEPVFGRVFSEGRYDIGKVPGFLQANIELALARDDIGPDLAKYLAELVRTQGLS